MRNSQHSVSFCLLFSTFFYMLDCLLCALATLQDLKSNKNCVVIIILITTLKKKDKGHVKCPNCSRKTFSSHFS